MISSTSRGLGDGQVLGRRVPGEQRRRDHVHPLVGALGREDRRRQQLEGVAVVELAQVAASGVLVGEPGVGLAGPGPPECGVGAMGGRRRRYRAARSRRYRGRDAPTRDRRPVGPRSRRTRPPGGRSAAVAHRRDDDRRRERRRRVRRGGGTPAGRADDAATADGGRAWRSSPASCSRCAGRCPSAEPSPGARRCGRSVAGSDEDGVAGREQPGLRLAPRAGRLDRGRPPPRARPSPGSTPRASCSTSATARLAGFCWTKVHAATATTRPLGEIYVIAVDPDVAGRGLGRAAHPRRPRPPGTGAGLDVGMLYVEGDNVAARARSTTTSASPATPPTGGGARRHARRAPERRRSLTGCPPATTSTATSWPALLDGRAALPRRPGLAGPLRAARRPRRADRRCPRRCGPGWPTRCPPPSPWSPSRSATAATR